MQRSHAALLAMACGGRLPLDLAEEVARVVLRRAARVQALLRRVNIQQLRMVVYWFMPPYCVAQTMFRSVVRDEYSGEARWRAQIGRLDQELCDALTQLAAWRDRSNAGGHAHDRPSDVAAYTAALLHAEVVAYATRR
jgi:hypothetical protein